MDNWLVYNIFVHYNLFEMGFESHAPRMIWNCKRI